MKVKENRIIVRLFIGYKIMKRIILFGSGAFGLKALEYFGKENIYAFCDNGCTQRGYKYGVPYIPFNEFIAIYHQYIVIISTNVNNSHEIANQLLNYDVDDFLVFDEKMADEMTSYRPEEYLSILSNDSERYKRERNQFIRFQQNVEQQLFSLKQLTDIKKLKPAAGYLAYVQRKITQFTVELFTHLEELNIKPFVSDGTALGLYRHGGFIPWDDDLDFGLIRDDYMKLLQFGKDNFIYIEEKASLNLEDDIQIENCFRKYPNEYIMAVSPNCIQIKRGTSEINACAVDFFSYDFYDDKYDFNEYKKEIDIYSKLRYSERGNKKILEVIGEKQYLKSNSNSIYFGLDNMDSFVCNNDNWIAGEVIFPLREIDFEGIKCYAPNNLRKLLPYYFKEYEGFPNDIRCQHLTETVSEKLKRDYIYCGIIVTDTDLVTLSESIYKQFRENGIYCVFVFNSKYINQMEDYIEIENFLINEEVEYIDCIDSKFDFLILSKAHYDNHCFNIPGILVEDVIDIKNEKFISFVGKLNINAEKRKLSYI